MFKDKEGSFRETAALSESRKAGRVRDAAGESGAMCGDLMNGKDKPARKNHQRSARFSRRLFAMAAVMIAASLAFSACGKSKTAKKDTDDKTPSASTSKKPGGGAASEDSGGAEDKEVKEEPAVVKKVSDGGFDLHLTFRENKYFSGTCSTVGVVPYSTKPGTGKTGQGGHLVGKYWYQAYILNLGNGELENPDVVVKYNIETGQVEAESDVLKMNHANDIAYNPHTNEIIVVNCMSPSSILTILDADTLAFKRMIEIEIGVGALDYNEKRNEYVAVRFGTQCLVVLDANFHVIGYLDCDTLMIDWTGQGICCDDDFIYFTMCKDGGNALFIYDWSGNYISFVHLPELQDEETENLTVVGNDIYIGTAVGGKEFRIYKVETLTYLDEWKPES